jgi:hypothetical protein
MVLPSGQVPKKIFTIGSTPTSLCCPILQLMMWFSTMSHSVLMYWIPRFVLILAVPIMHKCTWQFAHGRQLLANITFRFSSAQANLLILMAINDCYKGMPIAYIIFTTHADTKAIHVNYDTALMEKLISLYIKGLGTNSHSGQFCPSIAVTNYNKCKQYALVIHFPNFMLLICLFHIWQAWHNTLNKHLWSVPKGKDQQHVCKCLATFSLQLLKEVTDYIGIKDSLLPRFGNYFGKVGGPNIRSRRIVWVKYNNTSFLITK